jgi:hypothetical protein
MGFEFFFVEIHEDTDIECDRGEKEANHGTIAH